MKKLFYFPALLVLTLVGCNKIIDAPDDNAEGQKNTEKVTEGVPVTFSTQAQGSETKVILDGLQLKWATGDKIAVYSYKADFANPTAKDLCTLSSEPGSANGSFTPDNITGSAGWVTDGSDDDVYTFYSWYPATTAPSGTSETLTHVATTQNVGSGVGSYLICWATGNATKTRSEVVAGNVPNFSYTPKVSIVKVSLQNTTGSSINIKKIIVTSSSGNIAGDVTLNVKTGAISGGDSNQVELVLDGESGVDVANNETVGPYAVAILPTEGTLYFNAVDGSGNTVALGKSVSAPKAGHLYSRTPEILPVAANEDMEYNSGAATTTGYYYGVANCVVMPSGTTSTNLDISLFKEGANHTRGDVATNRRSAVTSAKLIWYEAGLVDLTPTLSWMGNKCTLNIEATSNLGGNALIGVYNASDELLWSFHVWAPYSTVYNDNVSCISTVSSYTAINMALGQVTGISDTFMFYQWGRKDPLGRAKGISTADRSEYFAMTGDPVDKVPSNDNILAGKVELAIARANPWIFYHRGSSGNNWKTSNDDNLWSGGESRIYDPCPEGYHVPSTSLWWNTNFYNYPEDNAENRLGPEGAYYDSITTNYYLDLSGLRYVVGGYRSHADGVLYGGADENLTSKYWSTIRSGDDSMNALCLIDTEKWGKGAMPQNGSGRASGFGVRCVKDSALGLNPGFDKPFTEKNW